jgi:hypothetical protein
MAVEIRKPLKKYAPILAKAQTDNLTRLTPCNGS